LHVGMGRMNFLNARDWTLTKTFASRFWCLMQ
jgi:hypothetical protein